MSRPTAPDLLVAAQAPVVRPFMAALLDYPSGTVRVTSLPIAVPFEGATWFGTGIMGTLSALEEGAENRSYGFSLSLSGIPGSWAEYLRAQDVQGRRVEIRLGFCNDKYDVLGSEVITVGRMDTQDVQAGATTSVLVSCESIQVDWERARVRRCTDVDQRARHPTDGFFKYVAAMENINLSWGRA